MLIGAWAVFSGARRQFLHHRIFRRRIERRLWRELPERRYRR